MQIEDIQDLDGFDVESLQIASTASEFLEAMVLAKSHSPAGWDYERFGEPDLVFMARTNGLSEGEMRENVRDRKRDTKPERTDNYTDDWDGAKAEATKRAREASGGKGVSNPDQREGADRSGYKHGSGSVDVAGRDLAAPKSPSGARESLSSEDARASIDGSGKWQAWSKHAVSVAGMDRATRRAALAAMPLPPPLINEPSLYFNLEDSSLTVDPEVLDHEKEISQTSMDNATKLMGLAPNGQVAEMQVNTTAMWHAKETEGHKLYEAWRVIDAKVKRGEASNWELVKKAKLETVQQELYGNAWKQSQEID